MDKSFDRRITEAKNNVKAWRDPAFKRKLKKDPQAALQEIGMKNISAGLELCITE